MPLSQLIVEAVVELDAFRLETSIVAEAGDTIGIGGDVGSGKSTLLRLVVGRLRATAGTVGLESQCWDDPANDVFVARRPVAMLGQRYLGDLAEDLTGVENVVAALTSHHNEPVPPEVDDPTNDHQAEARRLLSEMGVGDHVVDRLPWTFSGAEAQRVALARTLAPRPAVVLLDEPVSAFDKRGRAEMSSFLADWLGDHEGVVLVASTNHELLSLLVDRTIVLP